MKICINCRSKAILERRPFGRRKNVVRCWNVLDPHMMIELDACLIFYWLRFVALSLCDLSGCGIYDFDISRSCSRDTFILFW